jgi:hypothetical protein
MNLDSCARNCALSAVTERRCLVYSLLAALVALVHSTRVLRWQARVDHGVESLDRGGEFDGTRTENRGGWVKGLANEV